MPLKAISWCHWSLLFTLFITLLLLHYFHYYQPYIIDIITILLFHILLLRHFITSFLHWLLSLLIITFLSYYIACAIQIILFTLIIDTFIYLIIYFIDIYLHFIISSYIIIATISLRHLITLYLYFHLLILLFSLRHWYITFFIIDYCHYAIFHYYYYYYFHILLMLAVSLNTPYCFLSRHLLLFITFITIYWWQHSSFSGSHFHYITNTHFSISLLLVFTHIG